MTKKQAFKTGREWLSFILSVWGLIGAFAYVGYKAYGADMVKTEITKGLEQGLETVFVRLQLVEKENDTLKKDLKKLGLKQDFTNDVLYNMNPQAYLKTKKERKDKEN